MEYTVQYQQDLVGTPTSPETLTDTYTDNRSDTYPIGGMHSIVLYIQYTPAENGSILYVQYELGPVEARLYGITKRKDVSGDDSVIDRLAYVEKFVGTTASTTYSKRFLMDEIADKYVRFSFKEGTTGAYGTIYAEMLYSGK